MYLIKKILRSSIVSKVTRQKKVLEILFYIYQFIFRNNLKYCYVKLIKENYL